MKITANKNICQGYANCLVTADAYFDLDDDGKVDVLVSEPAPEDRQIVSEAVAACPVRALALEERDG